MKKGNEKGDSGLVEVGRPNNTGTGWEVKEETVSGDP